MRKNESVKRPGKRSTVIAAAVSAAIAGHAAVAQDSQGLIEEVIVTATKRAVSIQDVPVAVTSVSGEDILKAQIFDIRDLETIAPGLTVGGFGNNPQAVIRGAGTAGTTDIAVPIYHNGMYLPTQGQALAGYVDIDRVEVLRGPQGTLFGRNTYGGLINVITNKPDLEELDYGISAGVGDYSFRRLEGFVNIPIGDSVALRVTALDEERDPFVDNIVNSSAGLKDSNYTYIRGQLLLQLTDSFSVNFGATHWKDTGNGNLNFGYKGAGIPLDRDDPTQINAIDGFLDPRMGIYEGCPDGDRPGGRIQAGNVCAGDESAKTIRDAFTIDLDSDPIRELEELALYVDVNWQLDHHDIRMTAARFDYTMDQFSDADFSRNAQWFDGNYIENVSYQVDLAVNSSHEGPLQYTLGLYWFDSQDEDNINAYQFASLVDSWSGYAGATPQTPSWAYWNSEGRGGTESIAIYGQADYNLTDRLKATLGLRYTEDDRESQLSDPLPFDPASRVGPTPNYTYGQNPVQSGDDSNVDYRVGLSYDINDDTMVYASYATAYIAGGTDTVTQDLLDPQTNDTFEMGIRSILFDGKLVLNATVYNAEYEGLNTTQFVEQGGTGVAVAVQVPGGSITSRGVELEGYWYPTENFTVDFGATFEDSEYDEFVVGAGNLVWDGICPIGSEEIAGQCVYVMDGERTAYSPEFTLSTGFSYVLDLGDLGTITPYVLVYYNDGYMTNRAPVFFGEQDSFTKVNASIAWASPTGRLSAKLWVNNATDELIQTYTEIFSRARVGYDYQNPRMWGLRLGYNF